jgi:hypothetical protein
MISRSEALDTWCQSKKKKSYSLKEMLDLCQIPIKVIIILRLCLFQRKMVFRK